MPDQQLPDNRLRLQAPLIDFATQVGLTGQDHDNFAAPDSQVRYDWLRLFLIALLANQSSFEPPIEYREGSQWFDLNELAMKVMRDGEWVNLAEVIQLEVDANGQPLTLADFFSTARTLLGNTPTASFSGHSNNDGVQVIPIPTSLQAAAGTNSRPFIWVDGVLMDPRLCQYVGTPPTQIQLLSGQVINSGQTFTVLFVSVTSDFFSTTEVVV